MSEQISLKEIDGMLENQQVDNQADSNVTEETPKETVTFSLADIDAMLDEGEKKPDYAAAKKASDALNGTGSVAKQPTAKTEQKVEQEGQKKIKNHEDIIKGGELLDAHGNIAGYEGLYGVNSEGKKAIIEVGNTENPVVGGAYKDENGNEVTDTGPAYAVTKGGQAIKQTSLGARGQVVSDSEISGTNIGGDNMRVLVGWNFPGSSYSRLNLIPQGGIDWVKRNPNAYKEQLAELQGKSVQDAVGIYNKLAKGMDDLARVNPDSDTMARLYAIQEYVHAKDLGYKDNTDMRKDGQRYIYYNSYNGSPEIKALMDSGQRFRVDDYLTKAKIAVQSHPLKSVVDIQGAIGELFTPQDKALAWVTAMDNWKRGEASSIEKEYQRLLAEPLKQLHDEIVDRAADPSTAEYVFRSMGFGNDIVNAVLWAGRKLTGTSDKQGTLDLLREGNQKAQDKFTGFSNGAVGGLTMVANWAPAFASGYTTNAVMKGLGMSSGTMARIAGSSMLGKITRGAAFGSVNLPLFTYFDTVFDVFQNPQAGLGDVVSSFLDEETIRHSLAEAPTGAVLSPMAVLGEAFGRALSSGNKYVSTATGFLGESLAFAGSSSIKKAIEQGDLSLQDVWDCTTESVGTLLAMKAGHWGMNGMQGRANTMKNAKGEKVDTEQRKSGADQFGNQGMTELSAFLYNPRQYAKEHGITDSTDMRSTALGKEWESFLSRYQKGEVKDVDANSVATAMWLIDGKAMLKPISYSTELSADGKTVFSYDSMGNLIEERSFKNREKAEKWQEELRYDAEKYDMAKLEAEAAQRENEMAMQRTLDTMFDEVADQIPSTLANGEPDPNFNVNTRTEIYNIVANTKSALFILNNAKNLPAELASQYRRMVEVGTPFMERFDQLMAANRQESEMRSNAANNEMLRDEAMKVLDKKPEKRSAEEQQFLDTYSQILRGKVNDTPYVGTAMLDGRQVYVKNAPEEMGNVYYQAEDGSVKVLPAEKFSEFSEIEPILNPMDAQREQLESLALQNREAIEAAKKEAQVKADAKAQVNQQEIEEKKKNAPVIDVQQPEQTEPKVDGSETPSPSTETLQTTQAETPEPKEEEKSEASPEGKIEEPKKEEPAPTMKESGATQARAAFKGFVKDDISLEAMVKEAEEISRKIQSGKIKDNVDYWQGYADEVMRLANEYKQPAQEPTAKKEQKVENEISEEEYRRIVNEEQKWLDEHQEADPAEREQHRQRKWASERALGLRDENNNVVEQTPTVEQPKESETKSPTAQTERKTEEIAPAIEETPDMEITNDDLVKTTTLTEEDLADPEAGSLKRAARRKAEKQRDDAIAYSRGEIKDKPENFDYWKERLGLEEPKAENEMVETEVEPSADEANSTDYDNVKPIGKGVFGDIYDQFKGKAQAAIDFLRKVKGGVAKSALHHKDVGDIDLWYGDDKAGLKKIASKHPEVLEDLQSVLDKMRVTHSSDNRIILESGTHKAIVSKDWYGKKTDNWLLTAYEKKVASGGSIDIVPEPEKGRQNGTAPLQDNLSNDKDSKEIVEKQEKTEKNATQSQERAGLSAKEREIVNRVNAGINEAIDDLDAEIRDLEKKGDDDAAEAARLERDMLENSREDMIDDALDNYNFYEENKGNMTSYEKAAAERQQKSLADRKAKRMRELLEKLRDPNTSDVRRRAVVRQLADLGVDASGYLEGKEEIKEIEEVEDDIETPVEGVHESKGRVELNAATLKDPVSREYLEQKMEDEGWSEEARKQFMQTLDDAAEVVLEMGKRYKRLGDWNRMEILSETDEVDYNPRWRLMNRKGQWIPNRSAFKKNGEYPWNIDLGTLCTKRESFDALVQLIAEKGMAQNLGPTQIEAIKELLKDNDFLTACDICFNETKRARVISYANQISNNWRVVSEAIGVKDKMVGEPIALTQEQRNTLHRMAGRGYKSAFQELIPESERRQYKGEEKSGNEIDLGITASMMQRIAKQMLLDPTLVGKLKPETLITTEGMDWFLRTYGGHTDVNGILASAWGSGTPKPIEGFNLYDPLSWRDDYDQKKVNPRWHEGLKSRPSIDWLMNNGGFRAQSFTDYHPMLFLDYLQMFTDVGVRKLPMHIYTKVPALVKLFGGCGAKINMSLVPKMEDGVDAEHAGLKPDGKGGWEYAWDNDSFPIEEAFSLRQDPRFRGNVGIIAVGLSDAHILKMLDDPTIDQVIPYHKSGMPESVQIKTGLKNATDYTEQQTTGGKPKKAADFNFNEAVRRTGDPRKAASEYVKWCEMNGYTPKFEQFKDHPNYYKVLADFRLFDNDGKYSQQEAVNPGKILGDNWKQELEDSLNDKTMQESVKARVAGNEKLMKDVERLMSKQRMDGAVRDEMVKKLKGALGKDNVESLKQNEFFDALEDAYKQTMGAEQAKAKVEVLRTTNGVVYGFASGGKITLNENVFNAETPIHEFTHIWVKVAQRENAKLWKKGKDLLKQTAEWQEVMNDDLYADIRGDEDAVASEVLARIVGSEGADYVRRLLAPEHKPLKQGGVYNQIKEWLREMFNNVRSLFAPSIRNLTYDEFVNMPLKTLFDEAEAKRFLEAKTRLESEGRLEGDVEGNDVEMMGTTTDNKIEKIKKELEGKPLTDEQKVVVDVFTGVADRRILDINRQDGTKIKFELVQGTDEDFGSKHSVFGHYDTKTGVYTSDDILRIPNIIRNGSRKRNNKNNGFEYSIKDGKVTYTVVTQTEGEKEVFADFYSSWRVKDKKKKASDSRAEMALKPTRQQEHNSQDFDEFSGARTLNTDAESGGKDTPELSISQEKGEKSSTRYEEMARGYETSSRNTELRYRLGEEKKPTFYSNAEKAVEGIKQNKATAEQWKAMLTKAGGIKAGEDKWMGLSEWLDENKGKSLTKDEVMQFIKDNGIQMEETSYSEGSEGAEKLEELTKEFNELVKSKGSVTEAFNEMGRRYGDDFRNGIEIGPRNKNGFTLLPVMDMYDEPIPEVNNLLLPGGLELINGTRLKYTTNGLKKYREIAFKVPSIEPYQEFDEIHFGPENEGKAIMWVRFGETTDADGKRVLVIDEIQSNRHQDAREKGYISNELSKKLEETEAKISQTENELRELTKAFDTKYGGAKEWHKTIEVKEVWGRNYKLVADEGKLTKEEYSKLNELQEERDSLITQKRQIQEQKAKQDGVPAAPFEKNWHEVAMKRMLRLAAEEGFDKVAWTTGEQQAERYGIGGVVESITKGKTRGENTLVSVQYKNGKHDSWVVAPDSKVVDGGITTGENLSDLIGKELSEKVMSLDEDGSISGDGLRIGGEGMKGFYDQMLPRFMDKYGKKWGVKTGTVELPNVEEAGRTMHSIDVTPEMKESVMQGQPLFRKGFSRPRGEGHMERVAEGVEKANRQLGGNAKVVREADLGKDVPKNAQAWYDPNTGEVHVVAERVNGAEDASRAVWHEEIGHKAMSELLGDRYNEWLDDVHKLLGSEHADAMKRLREKYAKELEGKSEEAQNRLLADEWIAELAERGEKDLSTWQKVKGMFRNWLWKHFGVMLGDGDIDYMLHKALAERRKGYRSKAMMSIAERRRAEEGNAMAEQSRRYRLLDEENRAEAKTRARDLLEAERDELNDKKTQMEDALNRALTVRRGDPSAENLAMSPKQRRELAASIERLEKRIDALNDSLAETDLTDPERVVNRAWDHVGLATEAEMLMQKAESLMKTKDILRDAGVASVENLTPEQRKEYDRYLWNGKIADARLTAMRDARPERPFEGSIDDNLGREPQYDDFRHPDLDRDDLSERDRDYLERQANDNYSRAKAEWNRKKERLIEQLDDYEAECDDWRMRQRDYMREIVDAEKKLRADWQTDYWSAMENNQEADALLHVADMTGIPMTSKHDVQTYLRELRYEHVRRQQHAEGEDYKFIKEIESMVDKAVGTGSLANKVRNHGDRKQVMRDLIDMMEGTKEVTEEMKPIVKKIQQWFDDMFEWQVASGLVYAPWKYRQGYVPHLWNIDASRPDADAAAKIEKAGGLVPTRMNSPFMNERFYDTYEEGIQHGLVPKHESIIDLIKEYSKEVNKAVSNRQALDILRFVKAPIETEVWVEQEGGGKEKVTQTQWLPIVIDASEMPPKGVQYNAYKNSAFYKDGTPQFLILSPRYVKGTERNIYSMFGEQGYVSSKDAADSGLEKALGAADKLGQTVKQTNLSFSAFHAIALTEHMLGASKNPLRSTKRAIYDSLIESVITGKTLRQRKADVAEDAMSHFVKMGNSYDFDKSMDVLTKLADVINNPDNPEWKKFQQAKTDKERAKAAKALIRTVFGSPLKLVKMLKKGNDFILWDMLHDGYKLSVWDMRSKYLRKQAEKKGWSEAELNRRLDDLGQTINDMFGGQHWELLNASPRTMRNLRLAFLSPDWNASWMRLWGRMAGMGKLRNDNFFRGLKNEEGKWQSPISGKAIQKAWKENHAQYLSMTVMGMSALMAFVGYSLMNLAMRKKDIEEELAKAEEMRKTDPNYKSPYEEEGIKPITWENFLGRANEWILSPWNALNDPGKGTYVYIGKDESGRGRYLRPGKQMRELFELFLDEKDHLDLGAWYKAGLRKMNPLVGVGHEMMTGYSTSGWENKELTKTTGWERELNRLKYVALHTMLPMSIIDPVEKGDTDKMWWRMAYPVSKGMGWYKGRELLEEAIRNDDDQMVNRVRRAYVLNGMSADFESAYSKALGTIRKEKAKEEGYDDKTPKELFEMAAKSNDPKMREKLLEKAKEQIETTGMSEGKTAREAMAEYQQKTAKEGNYLVHCTAQDMEYDTHMKIFMKKAEEDGSVVATFRKMGGTIPKKTQVKKGKKVVDSRIEWKGKDGYTNADCEKFYKEHEDELIAYYRMNMFREGYNARIKEMKDLKGKEADAKMEEIRKYRDEWMQYASEYLDTTTWKVKKHKK